MSKGLIVLDPGHGRLGNPYPGIDGIFEGTQNHRLALYLKEELLHRGFAVVLTRPSLEDDPCLEERGRMAGAHGATLFLSIHSNAPDVGTPPERYTAVRGCTVFYSLADAVHNEPVARALAQAVAETMKTENLGARTRVYPDRPGVDYYGVLRHSAASGCRAAFLVEHGYHTNPRDAAFLTDDACLARLAAAEAEVLDRMVGRGAML